MRQEFDETKPIRDILESFEAQAPDFDSLFKGAVLGDASLRQICQTKFNAYEATPPSFDQLFTGRQPAYTLPRKKRMVPMWVAIGAAAACFILMLSLPNKIQTDQDSFSRMEQKKEYKVSVKSKPIVLSTSKKEVLLTNKLESPKTVKNLTIDGEKTEVRESLLTCSECTERDSSIDHSLTKMIPSGKANLAVGYERSVQEAYATAKVKKAKVKREKMILGTSINSANRLLSLVNTKPTDEYALQAIAKNYSAGYSSLEGTSTSLLRSATTSRNAWEAPDNISFDPRGSYDAVYSLPVNLGLSVSFPIFRNFEIMTGLSYTYMSGKISGKETNLSFDVKQELHYIGIPVKIAFNLVKLGRFGAYTAFGGAIEKGLAGVQNSRVVNTDGEKNDWHNSQKIYGFQSSITGQFGFYYELNKTFNIYLEPGASYFIPNDQPISSRTEEPFNFNIGLGLRYRIK
ncbi:MAG: porin family protein [Bacteroidales bacterium]|nr:porin family protein [Bacteroidales bacterium]